jgi:hypothetical protein
MMRKSELNAQQEIFCQKYALCGNASQSVKDAGYASGSAKVQGHKLLKKPRILERIKDLSQEMTTSYDVVAELEKQYAYAQSHGHTNSALKALEMLSRIRGNTSEKIITDPEGLDHNLLASFWVLGRKQIMTLMDQAEELGSESIRVSQQR